MISIGIALNVICFLVILVLRLEFYDYMSNISFSIFCVFCGITVFSDAMSYHPAWHYCCLGFSVASIVGFVVSAIVVIVQL